MPEWQDRKPLYLVVLFAQTIAESPIEDTQFVHRCANATPKPYVTAASITPTIVISAPVAHQGRAVTSAFDAPTAKCAIVLMMKDATTAGIPTVKKKGMIGMKPPMAVEMLADNVERQGLGKFSSESPSSSCTRARRNCFGSL
jgi:hypothetical protein